MDTSDKKPATYKFLFLALICYWIVDLARIQDVLPIAFLRPGIVSLLLICLAMLFSMKSVQINTPLLLMLAITTLLWVLVLFARNDRYAFNTALTFSSILLVCICINAYIRTRQDLVKLYRTLFVLTVYVAVYALLHAGKGSGGYIADENDVALLMNIVIPVGIYLWHTKAGSSRWLYLIGVLVLITAQASSMSRGGFVGLVCMSALLVMRSRRKLVLLVGISIALVTTATIVDTYFPSKSQKKVHYLETVSTSMDVNESTAQERLWTWLAAYEMFKDNPLGVGGNNFQVRFQEYQSERFKRGMWGRVAHSVWFTCLTELGVLGMILFIMLLKHNMTTCRKIERSGGEFADVIKPLTYSLVAFMATGTFISVLYYPYIWYLSAFISGIQKTQPVLAPLKVKRVGTVKSSDAVLAVS